MNCTSPQEKLCLLYSLCDYRKRNRCRFVYTISKHEAIDVGSFCIKFVIVFLNHNLQYSRNGYVTFFISKKNLILFSNFKDSVKVAKKRAQLALICGILSVKF